MVFFFFFTPVCRCLATRTMWLESISHFDSLPDQECCFPWHVSMFPPHLFFISYTPVYSRNRGMSTIIFNAPKCAFYQCVFPFLSLLGEFLDAIFYTPQLPPIHPTDSPVTSLFLLLELFLSESADATLCGEYSPSRHPGTAPGSLSPPTLSSSGPPPPPPPTTTGATTGGQASGALSRVSQGLNCQSVLW